MVTSSFHIEIPEWTRSTLCTPIRTHKRGGSPKSIFFRIFLGIFVFYPLTSIFLVPIYILEVHFKIHLRLFNP